MIEKLNKGDEAHFITTKADVSMGEVVKVTEKDDEISYSIKTSKGTVKGITTVFGSQYKLRNAILYSLENSEQ